MLCHILLNENSVKQLNETQKMKTILKLSVSANQRKKIFFCQEYSIKTTCD